MGTYAVLAETLKTKHGVDQEERAVFYTLGKAAAILDELVLAKES